MLDGFASSSNIKIKNLNPNNKINKIPKLKWKNS
jgi:hypothetical protein